MLTFLDGSSLFYFLFYGFNRNILLKIIIALLILLNNLFINLG